MNSSNSKYFMSVCCKNTRKFYRIKTVWSNNDFVLTLLDDLNAFEINVTEDNLQQLATKYDVNFEKYVEDVKQSLSKNDETNFSYSLRENLFLIFRQKNNISIQIADFNLKQTDFNKAALKIIDEIIEVSDCYRDELSKFRSNTDEAIQEKNVYSGKLEEFVNKKTEVENELYSKFILLLNEKKMRIQHLQEMLDICKSKKEIIKHTNSSNIISNEDLPRREVMISDSESSTTEEETQQVVHKAQIENIPLASPKKTINFLDFDNDDDISLSGTLPKRIKMPECETTSSISTVNNDAANLKETETSKETVSKEKPHENLIVTETENSLLFTSQDLYDRL